MISMARTLLCAEVLAGWVFCPGVSQSGPCESPAVLICTSLGFYCTVGWGRVKFCFQRRAVTNWIGSSCLTHLCSVLDSWVLLSPESTIYFRDEVSLKSICSATRPGVCQCSPGLLFQHWEILSFTCLIFNQNFIYFSCKGLISLRALFHFPTCCF